MYLFLPDSDREDIRQDLPDELLQITGRLEKVMQLELTPDRKLARADAKKVMTALEQQGFYLQMPPNDILQKDSSMLNNSSDSL
jgi:hypothetical protein